MLFNFENKILKMSKLTFLTLYSPSEIVYISKKFITRACKNDLGRRRIKCSDPKFNIIFEY